MIKLSARNCTKEQIAHIEHELPISAGIVKLVCGMSNTLAFQVMGNARDKLRKWPDYKFNVKREFEKCFSMWNEYEQHLLYPQEGTPRFFHVPDVVGEYKGKLREDLSDKEYFEFWSSTNATLYVKIWPFVTCLAHKFYRTMKDRNIPDAEYLQWALAGMTVAELACKVYRSTIEIHARDFDIPLFVLEEVMSPFDITRIAQQWSKAVLLCRNVRYKLQPEEEHNIRLTIKQLEDIVTDQDLLLRSVQDTIESFGTEVFRTKGMVKKSIRDIGEIINEVNNNR